MGKWGLAAGAVAAALVMNGCSVIPGLGAQSGPQACLAIAGPLQELSQQAPDIQTATQDPLAAAKALDSVMATLTQARAKVTNEAVGNALDDVTGSIEAMSTELEASEGDITKLDAKKLTQAQQDLQSGLTALAQACQP
ncbi:MAG: hypothetical protein K4304_07115 [Propionicimonas sp.]